jgi:hypothetical protein
VQHHSEPPPRTHASDALTAIIAATCVMVILTPVLVWLIS